VVERTGISARYLDPLCAAVDELLALLDKRLPRTAPEVRDWNDRLLIEAVARGARCLANIRRLAADGHSEDAFVLTRALVGLTLQHVWLARVEDDDERKDRFERLQRKWVDDGVVLYRELIDLGFFPGDGSEGDISPWLENLRERAEALKEAGVGKLPPGREMARVLDREVRPETPGIFELMYARIYRPASQVVHYGLSASRRGAEASLEGSVHLDYLNKDDAAEALGLALLTFALLLTSSDPIVKHGLTQEASRLAGEAHAMPYTPVDDGDSASPDS
jgi:hypothetical protein